jgi:23S rRNA pseudouridine1911/1915/1917 synthase
MPREPLLVTRDSAGERLDRFLVKAVPGITIERARLLCSAGHVRIRGKIAPANRKLWGNETIELAAPEPAPAPPIVDEGLTLPVLNDDDALVVVNKPAGMIVEPHGDTPSVVTLLAARLKGFNVDGKAQPGVVHRLDRDTSGCLALPKTDAADAALRKAFDDKRIEKRYLALVLGNPPYEDRLDTPYGRDEKDARLFTTKCRSARRAILSYQVRERFDGIALVDIRLETGRTHQIRVQLADAGFPVLSDAVYGDRETREHPVAMALGRQALHARAIALPHPTTDVLMAFQSPMPADFARVLSRLRPRPAK